MTLIMKTSRHRLKTARQRLVNKWFACSDLSNYLERLFGYSYVLTNRPTISRGVLLGRGTGTKFGALRLNFTFSGSSLMSRELTPRPQCASESLVDDGGQSCEMAHLAPWACLPLAVQVELNLGECRSLRPNRFSINPEIP